MPGHLVTKSLRTICLSLGLLVLTSGCETIRQLQNPSTPRTSYDINLGPRDRVRGDVHDGLYEHYRCTPLPVICDRFGNHYDCHCP